MKMIYNVQDKPKFGQMIVFALQQVLAILAATIAVPAIVGNGMSASAALFGAGINHNPLTRGQNEQCRIALPYVDEMKLELSFG